ncbi:nitroreductase family protein [Allomuricauda sp. d1]|uniref:nitroreductase family protein n=1 Tax=Allomuricauda sp. d1 TaxID=3136725 RepID=UPI0031D2DE95
MTETEQLQLEQIADTGHDIIPLLRLRYSPRVFEERKIPEEELKQLFEAARWAASSNNIQPWRFIYAEKGTEAFDRMVNCLSDFNQKWAVNAPILLFTIYKEETDDGKENFHALHDLGLAMGNMTIQAQHMGIALHHMAGVDWQKAEEEFNVPKGYHLNSAVALGYYGGVVEKLPEELEEQETAPRKRMEQDEFVYKNSWQ